MKTRYLPTSVSPFLLLSTDQYEVPQLLCTWGHRFQPTEQDTLSDNSTIVRRHAIDGLQEVSTIEAAEDYYLASALTLDPRTRHPFGHLTAFDLNNQISESAYKNRRGPAWVALMHPSMFDRIRYFKNMGKHWHGDVTQWAFEDPTQTIGRWTLQATEQYRSIHVWTSEHLPDDVMFTVYRDHEPESHDGIVVGQTAAGFALTPIDDDHTSIGTYVTKRVFR